MIPVQQTNVGGRGNCMSACFASILEIDIADVPDYRAIDAAGLSWINALNTWLSKHYQLIYIETEAYLTRHVIPQGWHLSNYGDHSGGHSVVAFFGRPIWDPVGVEIRNQMGPIPKPPYSYGLLVNLTDELHATWERTWEQCLCPRCIRGE